MNMLKAKIESILFIAARPLSIAKLSDICGAKKDEVADAVEEISERYESAKAGIRIVRH
jgi:chromosome segregation and condensation protein ScpB